MNIVIHFKEKYFYVDGFLKILKILFLQNVLENTNEKVMTEEI